MSFFALPPEIRVQIYDRVIFQDTRDRVINAYRLSGDQLAVISDKDDRNFKYEGPHLDALLRTPLDLSLLRTCRVIYREAKHYFYEHVILRIALRLNPEKDDLACLRFFRMFPPKCRPLVKNVEIRSILWWPDLDQYMEQDEAWRISNLKDWKMIARFMGECQGLTNVVLRGWQVLPCDFPNTLWERERIFLTLPEQTAYRIPLLPIHGHKRGMMVIFTPAESGRTFLDRIKQDAVRILSDSPVDPHAAVTSSKFSRFLELPEHIRKLVYRHTTVPANGKIHPYIGPWFDGTTRNLLPLLITNRQIYNEAQEVFFNVTTWTSLSAHHSQTFFESLHKLPKSTLCRIRHLNFYFQEGANPYEHLSNLVAPIIGDLHLETFLIQGSTFEADARHINILNSTPWVTTIPSEDTKRFLGAISFVHADLFFGKSGLETLCKRGLYEWLQMHLEASQSLFV
ncbi:MAG: hypothetical protein Q9172_005184 [Xanthocarpia lactea]